MKEHYTSLITSSALFFAAEHAGKAFAEFTSLDIGKIIYFILATTAFVFFVRGLFLALPYPTSGFLRSEFERDHPEVSLMPRAQRVYLYRQWYNTRTSGDQ